MIYLQSEVKDLWGIRVASVHHPAPEQLEAMQREELSEAGGIFAGLQHLDWGGGGRSKVSPMRSIGTYIVYVAKQPDSQSHLKEHHPLAGGLGPQHDSWDGYDLVAILETPAGSNNVIYLLLKLSERYKIFVITAAIILHVTKLLWSLSVVLQLPSLQHFICPHLTQTHTHTHTHTHSHTPHLAHTHKHSHTLTHTPSHTHTHIPPHLTHSLTHTLTHSHIPWSLPRSVPLVCLSSFHLAQKVTPRHVGHHPTSPLIVWFDRGSHGS